MQQAFLLPIAAPFALVGALIASKRRENPIGWLFLAFGVTAAIVFAAYAYAYRALVTHPGSLPGGDVAASRRLRTPGIPRSGSSSSACCCSRTDACSHDAGAGSGVIAFLDYAGHGRQRDL